MRCHLEAKHFRELQPAMDYQFNCDFHCDAMFCIRLFNWYAQCTHTWFIWILVHTWKLFVARCSHFYFYEFKIESFSQHETPTSHVHKIIYKTQTDNQNQKHKLSNRIYWAHIWQRLSALVCGLSHVSAIENNNKTIIPRTFLIEKKRRRQQN